MTWFKNKQILARIGAGFTVMGSLIWVLWPTDFSTALDPEPLFALATALVVWIATELKQSETVVLDYPTENDLDVASEFLREHSGDLRWLLRDTDLWIFVESKIYTKVGRICDRFERDALYFHNEDLNRKLRVFLEALKEFRHFVALNTTPELISGEMRIGFKPIRTVPQAEYDRLRGLAKEANSLATTAWDQLDFLAREIKRKMPSARPADN